MGFLVVDEIARRHQLTLAMGPSQVPETFVAKRYGADPLLVAKPLTFMNRSGDAVAALARYYDIGAADLIVVVDEVALPFGRLRARARGSAGGHNGLKSVDRAAWDQRVCPASAGRRARRSEARAGGSRARDIRARRTAELEAFIARAADAAEMFAAEGIEKVMNVYNPEAAAPEID